MNLHIFFERVVTLRLQYESEPFKADKVTVLTQIANAVLKEGEIPYCIIIEHPFRNTFDKIEDTVFSEVLSDLSLDHQMISYEEVPLSNQRSFRAKLIKKA